jgi:cytochrome c oxidase subunit 3
MTLILMGITALFVGLCGAYLYSRFTTGIEAPFPPIMFYVTIALLLLANRLVRTANKRMQADDMDKVMEYLIAGLAVTVIFAITQVLGWVEFFTGEQAIQKSNTLAYLFVLSALHHLHVVAGIPFLLYFIIKLYRTPVVDLQLQAKNKRYVKGLSRYWNFIDVLWILLVGMLLVSAFI